MELNRAAAAKVCRCGTRLPVGDRRLVGSVSSEQLQDVLGDRAFCSLGCGRAVVREGMETLDGTTEADSPEVCADVRELLLDPAQMGDWLERSSPASGRPR